MKTMERENSKKIKNRIEDVKDNYKKNILVRLSFCIALSFLIIITSRFSRFLLLILTSFSKTSNIVSLIVLS